MINFQGLLARPPSPCTHGAFPHPSVQGDAVQVEGHCHTAWVSQAAVFTQQFLCELL